MIGEVLQGFKLTVKLGESGTGDSYLAVHQNSGQKATAKVLGAEASSDSGLVAECFAQAKAANLVKHPGIAALYGTGVHPNGRAFLLTERMPGTTLAGSLASLGRVDDCESLAGIGCQVASLLRAVHEAGIVHGALQPDSVFLGFPSERAEAPLVKMLDFGIARLPFACCRDHHGRVTGAPLYMSPDAADGPGRADLRADVYSLGCILFEMACGRPPFVREDREGLLDAHAREAPPSVTGLEPSVPPAIATLIARMLSKSPSLRPQSMDEVARALEVFCRTPALAYAHPVAPTQVVVSTPPQPARARPDPTALLPPAPPAFPRAEPSARPATWVGRARQKTVVFDPPARPRRRPQPPLAGRPASRPALSLPVVIVTTAIIVAAGAALLLLRGRPTREPIEVGAPVVEVSDPEPKPAAEHNPRPVSPPEPATAEISEPEASDHAADEPTDSDREAARRWSPRTEKRRPAKRW